MSWAFWVVLALGVAALAAIFWVIRLLAEAGEEIYDAEPDRELWRGEDR